MKATVCLFTYGGVMPETMDRLIAEMQEWPFRFEHAWNIAALDYSRSQQASRFLQSDRDVFVSIDHDSLWTPGDVQRIAELADERKTVVGVAYSKRNFGRGLDVRWAESGEYEIPSEETATVRWVSGGFMAVHRSVFEKVGMSLVECQSQGETLWPFFLPMVKNKEYLTNDWSFCERAREAGFEILCDLRISLGHVGHWAFRPIDGLTELPVNGVTKLTVTV